MPIQNRLTQMLGIEYPVLLAPMDLVSGGRVAAAVTHAGGLGLDRVRIHHLESRSAA